MINVVRANNKGFTLIETVIYVALFSLLMVAFLNFSLFTLGIYTKAKSLEEVLAGSRQINRVMNFYIKDKSTQLIFPQATQASSSLAMIFSNGNRADFYLDSGHLMLRIDDNEPLAITANEIRLTNLIFHNYSDDSDFASIEINCKLAFENMNSLDYNYSYDFQTTINTRN